MLKKSNFIVPTANRPYLAVEGLPGLGFKPMNTIDMPRIWSAVIHIEAGEFMPKRHNTGLNEIMVVSGKGRYFAGQRFEGGDYLRETLGDYAPIEALEELILFITHHGECSFMKDNGEKIFTVSCETISKMIPRAEG